MRQKHKYCKKFCFCIVSSISELIKGERHDVEEMINNYADTPEAMKVISNSYILLKKYVFFIDLFLLKLRKILY